MDKPDEVVYVPWPLETIQQAWEEFRDTMYDDAGVEELVAGLHGMDFLMRASDIPDTMLDMIVATLDNARMRVHLMVAQEAAQLTDKEMWDKLYQTLRGLKLQCDGIKKLVDRYRERDPELTRESIRKYMEYRNNA